MFREKLRVFIVAAGHPIAEKSCVACERKFAVGDSMVLVPIGPGESKEARVRARQGLPYTATAVPTHKACYDGSTE